MFVDMHGKPCAKLVPVSAIEGLLDDGAGFAGFAAGPMGQTPSSPDILAMPDLSSYMPAPWRPGLGIIQCDPYVLGEPWPFAPRVILRRQIERLAEPGYALKVGAEAEYFLVRRSVRRGVSRWPTRRTTPKAPCYDARALTRMYDHLTTVSRHMNTLGLGELRQRPRGRQRAVRAELPLRRPADHRRPGDRVPLHGPCAGGRGRDARHLHAQALQPSDRERPAHAPQPLG